MRICAAGILLSTPWRFRSIPVRVGLLLDPFNGIADIEAKVLRVLHNYAFLEEPIRLIRATRLSARFHWPLEERTQARYDAAKENNYIEYLNKRMIGYELEQLAHEDDPIHIARALEREGWLKLLHPHWTIAKLDASDMGQVVKTRQMMNELGYLIETGPIVMYFLTRRMSDKDTSEIQRMIPRRDFVDKWKHLESGAQDLAKRLASKEASMPSGAWKILSQAAPENMLFLSHDDAPAGGRPKAQELLHQVAAGEREASISRDGGAAHHAPVAGISGDHREGIPAAAGRQAALAYRDHEFPEAL